MTEKESFRFAVRKPRNLDRKSIEDIESKLIKQLEAKEKSYASALIDLADFYMRSNRQALAITILDKALLITEDAESEASYMVKFGQIMEQNNDLRSAVDYYRRALAKKPSSEFPLYYGNNNLGYCLNHFSEYEEAELYCRKAISIDPEKHNAYKNLGVSQEGQGKYSDAALNYIIAIHKNSTDPRALNHLRKLLLNHDVSAEIPDIQDQLAECIKFVNLAGKMNRRMRFAN